MTERSGIDDTIAATGGSARSPDVLERGVVIGRYTVLSRVGAGAMGVVYAAYDPELDRKVALKLLLAETPNDGRRLQREAQALAKLGHPNVVAVHDVLEYEGRVVLAMEFVEGATLRAWLGAAPRSWREIVDVFVAAGRGLIAAHDHGLVHRDFKPDNVMLATSGPSGEHRVRVMDFGLAVPTAGACDDEAPRVGAIAGTPAYMAPEQFAGVDVGPAADQFAFCVALWEALYGERPFRGETVHDLARAVAEGDRSAPPRGAHVPGWLHRACERGLARKPSERFADMRGLVATLQSGHRRRQIRVAVIGFTAIAVLVVGVGLQRQRAHARLIAACEHDGAAITEVWNDSARAAVRTGLLHSGATVAETTADKVMPWLDEHAQAWQSARTEACLAHSVEQRWNDDMLDRAAWCFNERKLELRALVTTLADADPEAADRAVMAAAGLLRIEPCLDDATLRRNTAPPPAARDEIAEVKAELARAGALRATGAYEEGIAIARESVRRAELIGWPHLVAAARVLLGGLLVDAGTYPEAETIMESSYFASVAAGDIEHALTTANLLANLVGVTQARTDEGMRWAKHAEAFGAAVPDPVGLHEALLRMTFARIAFNRGNYGEAQILFEDALARFETIVGAEHPSMSTALNNLGLARFRRGDLARAAADFGRGLAITETTKGREHRDVTSSLNNLAIVAVRTGAYADAKAYLERALAVDTAVLGPTHPKLSTYVSNLGVVALWLGDFEGAIELHQRALAVREAAFGPEHPDVGASFTNLGMAHFALGHDDEAKRLHERALVIKTRTLGLDHTDTAASLVLLANVLQRRGNDAAAEPMLVLALAIFERALGPEHRDLSEALVGLAHVAIDRGRGADAVRFAERALALREHSDAPVDQIAISRVVLARALLVDDAHSTRAAELAAQGCATLRSGGPGLRPYLADCDAFAGFAKSSSSPGSERD